MGIGVDTIDMVMAAQPRSDGAEGQGQGQLLIKTVKLAFSVTNNVIRLKPPSNVVSPLEQALSQHGAHGNNLIAVLAKYIYHKHDPALPRLAIQLLKTSGHELVGVSNVRQEVALTRVVAVWEVCVLGLHLAKELCEVDEDGDSWLQVTRRLPILPTLLTTLEVSLRMKQNLHFTEATLHLLLTLARTQQGATAVAGAGITQSICLPLLSVYQLSTNGTAQTPSASRKSLDAPSWPGVYRLSMSLMERLLKTLRYNFLTEALDFVGVHQERTLQCLNAVRTVQSLACLEEADHTVGFILQLSNFMKEWHFHLPQLMRDIQVNLGYLCQACTSLLHSRKMLQHYLQNKNGDGLPSAVAQRVHRPPSAASAAPSSSKQPAADTEASEQRALHTVQYGLLKILSRTLAALRHFTPDVCQILLDQSLDLAEYNFLFALSFTTPTFDSEVAPSFGTLLATVNVALNMLGELDKKKEPLTQAVGLSTQAEGTRTLKSLLMFTMENCFYLLISQAMRYLRDPAVHPRDKQRMKQELSSELSTLLSSLSRYFRRGAPSSPATGVLPSPQGKSTSLSKASPESQEPLIQLVQAFVRHVQR
ncbi:hypothetical protein H8958_002092 [Nasalis larvatus]